jgi:hypothetical protein
MRSCLGETFYHLKSFYIKIVFKGLVLGKSLINENAHVIDKLEQAAPIY